MDAEHAHRIRLKGRQTIGAFFQAPNEAAHDAHSAEVDAASFALIFVKGDDKLGIFLADGVEHDLSRGISFHPIGDGISGRYHFLFRNFIGLRYGEYVKIACCEKGIGRDLVQGEAFIVLIDIDDVPSVSHFLRMVADGKGHTGGDFFRRNNVIDVVFAAACDKGLFLRRNGFNERNTGNFFFRFPSRKGGGETVDLAESALKAVSLHLLLMLCGLPAEKAGFAGGGGYPAVLLQLRAKKRGLIEMIVGIAVVAGDCDGDDASVRLCIWGEVELIHTVEAVRRPCGSESDECPVNFHDIGGRACEAQNCLFRGFCFCAEAEPKIDLLLSSGRPYGDGACKADKCRFHIFYFYTAPYLIFSLLKHIRRKKSIPNQGFP